MTGLKTALYAFWSQFGIPAYLSDSVPSDATLPYITYDAVQGEGLSTTFLTAITWHNKSPRGNEDRGRIMDMIAKAIPPGGAILPVPGEGYAVMFRNAGNFQSDYADEEDDAILGGRTSYQINFYL